MYVRVVRFTDVNAERMEGLLARIKESDGPPPGVPATGLTMMFDEAQGTAVVLQHFATAEDMSAGAQAFSAMDGSETPGVRASVDNMAVGISNGGELMVRVGPDASDEALARPHTRVFDMTGRPMKGWILVSAEGFATKRRLGAWVRRGMAFARALPTKG